ncbi:hypothetical protein DPEC_G00056790 [Dallia pectoralis]|uniref:Uncharacterized protein n=1 Tax=Dallia pectoralis TaxID=75939 RepID=A0ACC2H6D1_DALPE|nr:hypothetical protein DPEC_G00056790 [Dallia pectoralis]
MDAKCLLSLLVVVGFGVPETQGQDARVKLCGREFIRMVVASCGSSRLKRATPDHGIMLDWVNSDQFANIRTIETEAGRHVVKREDHQDTKDRLTDDQLTHQGFTSAPQQVQGGVESATIPLEFTIPSRTRRDLGPAGVCCQSGCTMSELVQYC